MPITKIYGPPGTGKTTRLLSLMQEAADDGTAPTDIGFFTFTKNAANEALRRLKIDRSDKISTLHALAFRACDIRRAQVVNWSKLQELGGLLGYEFRGGNSAEGEETRGDRLMNINNLMRSLDLPNLSALYDRMTPEEPIEIAEHFVQSYTNWKKANGYVDFNDMLTAFAASDIEVRTDVLFIDEAQDLTPLQWRVAEKLMKTAGRVYLAGDDDQCLYEWGGAEPLRMASYAGTDEVLGQSYRVPRSVHAVAGGLASMIRNRVPKQYAPRPEDGEVAVHRDIRYCSLHKGTTFVLYRNHHMRYDLENWIWDEGIPYEINGRPSLFTSRVANLIRQYIRLGQGKSVDLNVLDAIAGNTIGRVRQALQNFNTGIAKQIPWNEAFILPREHYDYFMKVGDLFSPIKVKMSTIHASKGSEADQVILLNSVGSREMFEISDPEYRVWYTGVTRAKKRLDIIEGDNPLEIRT